MKQGYVLAPYSQKWENFTYFSTDKQRLEQIIKDASLVGWKVWRLEEWIDN